MTSLQPETPSRPSQREWLRPGLIKDCETIDEAIELRHRCARILKTWKLTDTYGVGRHGSKVTLHRRRT